MNIKQIIYGNNPIPNNIKIGSFTFNAKINNEHKLNLDDIFDNIKPLKEGIQLVSYNKKIRHISSHDLSDYGKTILKRISRKNYSTFFNTLTLYFVGTRIQLFSNNKIRINSRNVECAIECIDIIKDLLVNQTNNFELIESKLIMVHYTINCIKISDEIMSTMLSNGCILNKYDTLKYNSTRLLISDNKIRASSSGSFFDDMININNIIGGNTVSCVCTDSCQDETNIEIII